MSDPTPRPSHQSPVPHPAAGSIADSIASEPIRSAETASVSTEDAVAISAAILEAVAIMARLRAPDGCPWDREQNFDSIQRHTLEETYEVFDAIERRAWPDLKDELGDLLLQILFYSQMAHEAGYFTFASVVENLNAKLIRRHPHVFGSASAEDSAAVLRNWEQIKREEKAAAAATAITPAATSLLDSVPRSMPAILEAAKLSSKAAKVGFDWPNPDGLFDKLQEEIGELKQELAAASTNGGNASSDTANTSAIAANSTAIAANPIAIAAELGDILFTAVNLARHLHVDPEFALRSTNRKFRRRFQAMEASVSGHANLESLTASELEELWRQAKLREAEQPRPSHPPHAKPSPTS